MIYLTEILAFILVLLVLPGALVLLFLTIGALFAPKHEKLSQNEPKLVVIIPAHNEEEHLQKTLDSLKLNKGSFTIAVVADNCQDTTAEIARSNNVRVIERFDEKHLGKHYALNYAFSILLKEDFEVFLVVDADCICAPNLIYEVQHSFPKGVDGVQVRSKFSEDDINFKKRLLKIAFDAVNFLRPLGRQVWGLSSGIFGTGFAVTRKIIENIKIPSNSVVEDACWNLKIVSEGYFVRFNPNTYVESDIPYLVQNISKQRSRWEGGRLKLIVNELPNAFKDVLKGKYWMIEPCMELMLPPLSYFAILLIILLLFPFGWSKFVALSGLSILLFHVVTTLIITKASWKDWAALLLSPLYLIAKVFFIFKLFKQFKSKPVWEKTPRDKVQVKTFAKKP